MKDKEKDIVLTKNRILFSIYHVHSKRVILMILLKKILRG